MLHQEDKEKSPCSIDSLLRDEGIQLVIQRHFYCPPGLVVEDNQAISIRLLMKRPSHFYINPLMRFT